jgi:hypothetical protein
MARCEFCGKALTTTGAYLRAIKRDGTLHCGCSKRRMDDVGESRLNRGIRRVLREEAARAKSE